MVDLHLEVDEGILLQATEVERYGRDEYSLDEMVLTNKYIICVYEKGNGLFAKSESITFTDLSIFSFALFFISLTAIIIFLSDLFILQLYLCRL